MPKLTALIALVALLGLTSIALAGPRIVWSPGAKMPIGKGGQVCGVIDGKMVLAGGTYWIKGETKVWSGDSYIYDPAADTWSKGADLPFPVSYGTGQAIDNKLYVVSGSDGERDYTHTMIYKRIGRKYHWVWGPPVPEPRIYSTSVAIGTKLYVIAGARDHAIKQKPHQDIIVLDTAHPEQGWKQLRAMPGTGRTLPGVAALGDKIYVFGGYRQGPDGMANSDDAFVYDTTADRWTRLPEAPYAARCWDGIAVDGQVYILGGYVTWPAEMGRPDDFTDTILRFDPATNEYSAAGQLPLPNITTNPRLLPDGRIFIAGGEDQMKHRTDVVALGVIE